MKASKDPSFLNIFLFFLHKYFGDLVKETVKEYIAHKMTFGSLKRY
nr:hypothetical protein [Sulfolobus acidocaldarius]